ncbi:MAG: hypothetical protein K0R82_2589 [Flavipsychrobacter sp.]|jgi:hypothetical protein|nr:hypothetical protein [Flavipsychrobacter sp.]
MQVMKTSPGLIHRIPRVTEQSVRFAITALAAVAIPATANAQGAPSTYSAFELFGVILLFLLVITAFFKILAHNEDKSKPTLSTDSRHGTNKHTKTTQARKYRPKHS